MPSEDVFTNPGLEGLEGIESPQDLNPNPDLLEEGNPNEGELENERKEEVRDEKNLDEGRQGKEGQSKEKGEGKEKVARPVTTPNVIFIGKRRDSEGKKVPSLTAPAQLINGPTIFSDLPSSEEQAEGFYYENAAELCRAFPGLYKRLVKKGE